MMFKKSAAVHIDKMNVLNDIQITEENVKLHMNYSSISFTLEEIPKLLSDVMQLYVYVKPLLDKKEVAELKKQAKSKEENIEEPIDLSSIPF